MFFQISAVFRIFYAQRFIVLVFFISFIFLVFLHYHANYSSSFQHTLDIYKSFVVSYHSFYC